MRILIVDDEVEVARVLADAVDRQGHVAVLAHRGEEALAALARERPDAVFLDVRMPGLSGIEVLRRIRRSDPTLPVVLITGHAEPADLDAARQLGVTEIIEKPLLLKHLEDALAGLRPQPGPDRP
jgi:CheY-like chemotaxis protein